MNSSELNNLCNSYQLTPIEISCILLQFQMDNKTLSFSYSIGYIKKSKNKDVLAYQFFARESVQKFIAEQKNNFVNNTLKIGKTFDNESGQVSTDEKTKIFDESISSENIKERLESELSKINDPDKRAVILMKIADFVGLKNSDQDDPLTPTIYLPARCSQCKQLKTNAL